MLSLHFQCIRTSLLSHSFNTTAAFWFSGLGRWSMSTSMSTSSDHLGCTKDGAGHPPGREFVFLKFKSRYA